jgi:hypothetical protein
MILKFVLILFLCWHVLSITNRDVLKFFKCLPIASVDSVIFSKYFKAFLAHIHTKHVFCLFVLLVNWSTYLDQMSFLISGGAPWFEVCFYSQSNYVVIHVCMVILHYLNFSLFLCLYFSIVSFKQYVFGTCFYPMWQCLSFNHSF